MRLDVLLVVAAFGVSPAAPVVERSCATPYDAVHSLLYWLQPEHYDVEKAARCVENTAAVERAARLERVQQLKEILDGRGLLVNMNAVPSDPAYVDGEQRPRYVLFSALPSVFVVRRGDTWLWSTETLHAIPHLYKKTYVVDVDGFVSRLPPWMFCSFFGVGLWQIVGLFALILVGVVCRFAVMLGVSLQARTLMRRIGAHWGADALSHVDRPLGTLAGAGLAAVLWPLLRLPVRLSHLGLIAVRVIAAFAAVWVLYKLVDVLSAWTMEKASRTETKLDDQLVPLVRRALKIFIWAVGVIFVLQNLNIDVGGLLAGLGLGGLAVALAARETVANLFGSATIFADRPFHIGDWVEFSGKEGVVESVGFRSTKIRTFYNSVVCVPNAAVANAVVDNYGARVYRRCKVVIGVTYDTPPDKIDAFVAGIRGIIDTNAYTRKDYHEVHFNEFGPSSLNILVYFFFRVDSWSLELQQRHEVFLHIMRLAASLGVSFAFPTQTVYLKGDGEQEGGGAYERAAKER